MYTYRFKKNKRRHFDVSVTWHVGNGFYRDSFSGKDPIATSCGRPVIDCVE